MSQLHRIFCAALLSCVALLARADDTPQAADVQAATPTFEQQLAALPATKLWNLPAAVKALAASGGQKSLPYLKALADEQLYFRKSDGRLFRVNTDKQPPLISDPVTGKRLAGANADDFKKLIITNAVRRTLRNVMAPLELQSANADVRADAVSNMFDDLQDSDRPVLQEALGREHDSGVKKLLTTALATLDLNSSDADTRLAALNRLVGSLQPQVRNRVSLLLEKDDGKFAEPDARVRQRAKFVVESIDSRLERYKLLQTVFFGLSMGSVLLLAAIGLAITFGVMGVINMAHGELIMLGAYTTYVIQQWLPNQLEYSLLIAVPAAFLVSGLVGVIIERGVIRWLYGRPLETLLATFGISLILQQAVRTIFSPLNRDVATPDWMSGSWQINPAFSLTFNRLYIVIFSLVVFALLSLLLKKTSLGLYVRAVSQNRAMAKAMGVRSDWIDALTFGLGSGIAGIAGVALSQLTNVGPNMGQSYIIDSFMVVVFGGVGNLWGTLVGGLTLGIANKFIEPLSGAVLAKILVLVFIIFFIQKRPRGLFPQKGRAAES